MIKMSIPWMSLRDRRLIQLYDDYKYACERYEHAMKNYSDSQLYNKYTELAKERLDKTKQIMNDAEKEFIEFAKMDYAYD